MRKFIKCIIRMIGLGSGFILLWPLALLTKFENKFLKSKRCFIFGAQSVSLLPGFPGEYLRAAYYMMTLKYFHPTAIVGFGTYFSSRATCVEREAKIGVYCIIGKAEIKSHARIASRVSILSGIHEHGNAEDFMKGNLKVNNAQSVVIGSMCWIGEGAIIAANVGDHSLVGAGSVLLNPLPKRSLAIGNPARQIPIKQKPNTNE